MCDAGSALRFARNATEPTALLGVQVNASEFVKRDGAKLVLDGRPFYFAGFCNYYMLTRAADKTGSGRKEVRWPSFLSFVPCTFCVRLK